MAARPYDHASPDPEPAARLLGHRRLGAVALVAAGALALGIVLGASAGGSSSRSAPSRPAAAPLPGRAAAAVRTPVPILMFHGTDRGRDPQFAAGRLHVKAGEFRAELRWLAAHRYEPVTMAALDRAWRGRGRLPRRPVVLSFDDGYRSQYTVAYRALRARGWPGVINLAVKNLTWSRGLSFDQVQRMLDAGWELSSHTINHPNLTRLGDAALRHEVVDSRRILQLTFGVRITAFSYPGGAQDARVRRFVRRAGYSTATAVAPALAVPADRFALARIRVDPGMGAAGLGRRIDQLRRAARAPASGT